MNCMLALRRFRLTLMRRLKSNNTCSICGDETAQFEYVCGEEACQMEALSGQAMLANSLAEPPASLYRVSYTKVQPAADLAGTSSCV